MRTLNLRVVAWASALALVSTLAPGAFAQCGLPMTTVKPAVFQTPHLGGAHLMKAGLHYVEYEDSNSPTIVGLWHIKFFIGNQMIQEAFQIWNLGGTEVHNPNLPLGGNVCLGTWKQFGNTYKLAHRLWLYDPTTLAYLGTIHLSETLKLTNGGNQQNGTFIEDIYDPSGTFQSEVSGTVTGTRISVE